MMSIALHDHQFTTSQELKTYLLAGRARITAVSKRSHKHFTYSIHQNPLRPYMFWVSVLYGEQKKEQHPLYLGTLFIPIEQSENPVLDFTATRGSKTSPNAPSFQGFVWLMQCLNAGIIRHDQVEIWRDNVCGRCNRTLTNSKSIEYGVGPVCRNLLAA